MENSTKIICPSDFCTGCFACREVCPQKAIETVMAKNGFAYPHVTDACINCGLCEKACPQLNQVEAVRPQYALAAYAKRWEQLGNITSGGMATLLYYHFICNVENAVVYGVAFDHKSQSFEFRRCTEESDIAELSGSKYIQPNMNDVFSMCRKDLAENRKVLFVGSPCQVAAARKCLQTNTENLYLVDIICHGMPSQKMLFESLKVRQQEINLVRFRNRNKYQLAIEFVDGKCMTIASRDSVFYEAFSSGKSIRQSCHVCMYAKNERISDLTLGDFWGLSPQSRLYEKQSTRGGVSLALVNSDKGNQLIKTILPEITAEKRPMEEAFQGNSQLNKPVLDNKYSMKFRTLYENRSFAEAVAKSRDPVRMMTHWSIVKKIIKKVRG